MGERSAQVDKGSEPQQRAVGPGQDQALAPGPELLAQLSMLGNRRVQRLLSGRHANPRTLQRQDEGAEEKKLPPYLSDMIIGSRGLLMQAGATLDSGKSEDIPVALQTLTSAGQMLTPVITTLEGHEDVAMLNLSYAYSAWIKANQIGLKAYTETPVSIERLSRSIQGVGAGYATELAGLLASG